MNSAEEKWPHDDDGMAEEGVDYGGGMFCDPIGSVQSAIMERKCAQQSRGWVFHGRVGSRRA
jgi:hypothetical protein